MGLDEHLCVRVCAWQWWWWCLIYQLEYRCYSLSSLHLLAEILPGRVRYFPAVLTRLFTKDGFKYPGALQSTFCTNAALRRVYLNGVLPVYLRFSHFFFLPSLYLVLCLPLSHTHTHISYLFSHESLRGLQPLIVSQTGTGEREWLGLQGVSTRETGKAGHSSLRGRKSLSHITAHIHLLGWWSKFTAEFRRPWRC